MKIISNEEVNKSLNIAKSFVQKLDVEFVTDIPDTDELVIYVNPIVQTKDLLFSAESLTDLLGVYGFYTQKYEHIIIIPQNHIDYYKYPEPTLLNFAGNKLWRTSSRLAGNLYFGKAKDIKEIIKTPSFNNGIFYQGKYTIIVSVPSLIVDTTDEQLPTISHQMFDIEGYKTMIDDMPDMV